MSAAGTGTGTGIVGNAQAHRRTGAQKVVGNGLNLEQENPESGRTPYWARPMVEADQDDRRVLGITAKDYGNRWKSAYRYITGDAPRCGPGEHAKARDHWRRIVQAIEHGGWSAGELGHLYRAEKLWGRRWRGLDARFEVMGTRSGRATFEDREKIRAVDLRLQLSRLTKGLSGVAL